MEIPTYDFALHQRTRVVKLVKKDSRQQWKIIFDSKQKKLFKLKNISNNAYLYIHQEKTEGLADFTTVDINNYREIFLGGGSVLLALLSYAKKDIIKIRGNIYAYDLNEPLINIYKNIQSKHNELYAVLKNLIDDFSECGECVNINRKSVNIDEAKEAKENYYYWIRNKYNSLSIADKNDVIGSAMFIFLNKTCFRGLFRVGPNGFNVPYGNYKNPEIINKNHLDIIHDLIKDVIFTCCDFRESMINIEDGDFLYLDPPYVPEKNTSFVGYNKCGFDIANHNELFAIIHTLKENNVKNGYE